MTSVTDFGTNYAHRTCRTLLILLLFVASNWELVKTYRGYISTEPKLTTTLQIQLFSCCAMLAGSIDFCEEA